MKRILASATVLAVLILMGACASMSADECAISDWRSIGYEDGVRGYTADRIAQHRKACARHGFSPVLDDYRQGREEGLREFCQPSRGFSLGSSGGQYQGVCASDLEPGFLDGFHTGQHLYTLRSNVNSAANAIQSREDGLERIRVQVRETEAALISRETTTEDRVILLSDLKDMSEEAGRLEAEIIDLVEERAYHEHQLAAFEAVLADSVY